MAQNVKNLTFSQNSMYLVTKNWKFSIFSKIGSFFPYLLFFFFLFPSILIQKNSKWAIFRLESIFNGQRPPFRPKWTYPENFMASAFVVSEPLITKNFNPCCIVYIGGFFSENDENGENGPKCQKSNFFQTVYVIAAQKTNFIIFAKIGPFLAYLLIFLCLLSFKFDRKKFNKSHFYLGINF